MALIDTPTSDVWAPITPEEAKKAVSTGSYGNEAILKLVNQNAVKSESFQQQKMWVLGWNQANILYQSPPETRTWDGTTVPRSNVPFYTVATAVNSLVPQVVNGLFYENPPFIIQERPGTKSQAARALGAVIAYQLETVGSQLGNQHNTFREELRLGVMNAVLSGTGLWKYGWESYTRERSLYRRKNANPVVVKNPLADIGAPDIELADDDEEIEQVIVDEVVEKPSFEHIVELAQILVDPGCNVPDIRAAKWVIHRQYMTFEDLDALRDRPGFTIPPKNDLLDLFFPPKEIPLVAPNELAAKNPMFDARAEGRSEETTVDPRMQPLEVLEYWDNKKCYMVLQKKVVICDDDNPYGQIPFLSVNFWDVPGAFWGLGLGKTIGSEQRLQQGITNTWIDNAALALNGVYVRVKGKSVPTQSIRIAPGKIVEVDAQGDFEPLKRLDPVPEAGQHIALSDARAEKVSGSNEITGQGQAGNAGHSNLARSAAGANLLGAGAANRTSDFVEKIANQVMVPFLFAALEMDRALLPMSTLRHILSKELQHEYMNDERDGATGEVVRKGGDLVELLNAEVKFSVLAAAKMQARRNMAQALPILIQFLTSPEFTEQLAIQGKKIDIEEVIRMFFTVSDWKNETDVVVDMTPEDKQRYQQRQQGAQMGKVQGQAMLENQKFQQKQKLLDQENEARAARDVLRHAVEQSAAGTGFGSQA